uniref:General transcription factor IIH subunit 4 n=1 Tax=Magallana gigas TaxID=29159 RepID=K1PW55_MAGGI
MASVSKKLECKDLHGYLKTLPSTILDKLYNHPATCLAVFREHKFAAKVLSELRVWHEQQMQGGLLGWVLNGTFRSNMKVALLGGGMDSQFTGGPLPPDKHAKDVPFLDKYALERWECVLHFMVGSTEGTEGVSKDIIDVLLNAGLMTMDGVDPMPSITPAGFQFLLMDIGSQVWYFMLQYLDTVEARGMDLIDCLSFLFQLSFSTLGKRKIQRYYPTRLAINLAAGQSDFTSVGKNTGYLMVETNYRVYAYTDSPLQVALVALFCEMLYRFPTFSVGNLTRVSVRDALIRGITADQTPVIPSTVTDQVRLWELERDRFKFMEGVLYDQFLSQNDFELLRDYAKDLGVLLWDNAIKRVMVVTKGGHDDVKRYWKRQKQSNS